MTLWKTDPFFLIFRSIMSTSNLTGILHISVFFVLSVVMLPSRDNQWKTWIKEILNRNRKTSHLVRNVMYRITSSLTLILIKNFPLHWKLSGLIFIIIDLRTTILNRSFILFFFTLRAGRNYSMSDFIF